MSDEEFLMSSRQRRSNAGSRLKQLISMESETAQASASVSQFVDEDDENVNLLFQEDEDDQEFEESEEEESGEEEEEQAGDDQEQQNEVEEEEQEEIEQEETNIQNELNELDDSDAGPVDSDDVLSDSDISLSDDDVDEGERELESEERKKKRKQKLQSRLVPKIKKFKAADPKKPKSMKPKKVVTSESLLQNARRVSSRASVIENKEALVQKMKLDEKRRAATTPIVREKQRELTQEEKLAEAVETEKANILSLELFQQQEVVKKERQKHLLNSRRPKMVDVLSLASKEEYITPTEEVENAIKLFRMITGKSRKRHIKKLKELFEVDLDKFPGEIDKSLPYYKEEQRLKELAEEKKKTETGESESAADMETKEITEVSMEETAESQTSKSLEILEVADVTSNEVAPEIDIKKESIEKTEAKEAIPDENALNKEEPNSEKTTTEGSDTKETKDFDPTNATDMVVDSSTTKNVTFADDVKEPTTEPMETSKEPSKEPEEKQRVKYEGPAQRVVRNSLTLLNFDEVRLYDEDEVKSIVLGEQSLLPAPRRFKEMKTILRIGNINNPYAKVKVDKDEIFSAADELTMEDPMFEELNRLPKLGIRQAIVEEVVEEDTNDAAIRIVTEAPIGIYLPNGNKKLCLITGNEVKYFDPSLGVPYSDVETFKFLKSMEQGNIPWYSFDASYNDTGATEIYLGSRDGSSRSARGVPEGFDA